MDTAEATELLTAAGCPARTVTPIHGGWASWTFDVDGRDILRVARDPEIATAHRREARLLPVLSRRIAVAVPQPTTVAEFRGRTYMIYPRVPGRALRPGDPLPPVATVLRRLHAFPAAEAAELLGCGATAEDWQRRYRRYGDWITAVVLPELPAALRPEVVDRFQAGVAGLDRIVPRLVHADLGTEHIMVDPDTGAAFGLIDFETATVGDPAIDFVGLLMTLGFDGTERLITEYAAPVDRRRMRFYWWLGAAHAIKYGVDKSDRELIADGVAGLRDRLSRLPTGD